MNGNIEVLLDEIKSKNMELSLNDDNLKVSFNGEPDEALLQAIRDNKEALVRRLSQQTYQLKRTDKTAEDVIRAIYAGTFTGAALIPVLQAYQAVLGQAVWVCATERQAARKRHIEAELVFTVDEFKAVVETALQGIDGLRSVINVKRTFGGIIGVA